MATGNRGFASMDEERQRQIASQGGKAAHEKGTAHEFDSREAAEAGRKGGQARAANSGNGGAPQGNRGRGTQGGSAEQHARAGRQNRGGNK
jgi:hypothetical protein